MITGIPLGLLIRWLVPLIFSKETVAAYSLDNFFIISGIAQAFCIVIMVIVSLFTEPKPIESISSLLCTRKTMVLPGNEPERPLYKSFIVWFTVFVVMYAALYVILW